MMRILLALAIALTLAAPALAQLGDDDYITQYFGTTAIFTTKTQIVDPNQGWWGDKLPQQLTYDYGFVTGVVNTVRSTKKVTPLLEADKVQITTGWEEQVAAGWQYTLDFSDMRPSEVQAVIDALGGMGKVLPGAELSFRPLLTHNFYAAVQSIGDPVLLTIGATELSLQPASPIADTRQKVAAALKKQYGKDVPFDLYINQFIQIDGTQGADVSVYANMAPAANPPAGVG
jgi:hypothetical protein